MRRIKSSSNGYSLAPHQFSTPTDSRSSVHSKASSAPSVRITKQYSDLQSIPQDEPVLDFSASNSCGHLTPEPPILNDLRHRIGLHITNHFTRHQVPPPRAKSLSPPEPPGESPPTQQSLSAPTSVRSTPSLIFPPQKADLLTRFSNAFARASTDDSAHINDSGRSTTGTSSVHCSPNNSLSRNSSYDRPNSILRLGRPSNPAPSSGYSTWNTSLSSGFFGPVPHDKQLRKEYATRKPVFKLKKSQKRIRSQLHRLPKPAQPPTLEPKKPSKKIKSSSEPASSGPTPEFNPLVKSPKLRNHKRTSTEHTTDIAPYTPTMTTHTTHKKPSLLTRLTTPRRSPRNTTAKRTTHRPGGTTTTTTTTKTTKTTHHGGHATHGTTGAVHHHKRKPSMGDKVSGALTKLRGSLTGKPGVKAVGTRRMHGTDGRGSRVVR